MQTTLLHLLLGSTLILGVMWILMRIFSSVKHAICCCVMLGLIAFPFLMPLLPSIPLLGYAQPVETAKKPEPVVTPSEPLPVMREMPVLHALPLPPLEIEPPAYQPIAEPVAVVTPPEPLVIPWAMIIVSLWGTVAFVLTVRFFHSLQMIARMRRHSREETMPQTLEMLESLRKKFRISRPVRILRSEEVPVPFTTGILRPLIFLPMQLSDASPESLRLILMHEMIHIQRFDTAWQILSRLVKIAYWFQPLVYLLTKKLQTERELACDLTVLRNQEDPEDYANVLLNVSEDIRHNRRFLPGCAVAMARTPQMESRIQAILAYKPLTKPLSRLPLFFAIMLIGVTTAFAAALSPTEGENVTEETPETQTANEKIPPLPVENVDYEGKLLPVAEENEKRIGFFKIKNTKPKNEWDNHSEFLFRVGCRVFLPDGQAAKNASVYYTAGGQGTYAFSRATTDETGYFQAEHLSSAYHAHLVAVAVSEDEKWVSPVRLLYDMQEQKENEFEFHLEKGTVVSGTVLQNGKPVPDQRLYAQVSCDVPEPEKTYYMIGNTQITGTTDSQGKYSFLLPAGKTELVFYETPWNPQKITISDSLAPVNLDLQLPSETKLRVLDANGKPASEAKISGAIGVTYTRYYEKSDDRDYWGGSHGFLHGATNAADGIYTFFLSPLYNTIVCRTDQEGGILVTEGEEYVGKELTLPLKPFALGRIRLVSQTTGKPIVGVKIEAEVGYQYKEMRQEIFYDQLQTKTDLHGYATFPQMIVGAKYKIELQEHIKQPGKYESYITLEKRFAPEKPGELNDFGEIKLNGDFSQFEGAQPPLQKEPPKTEAGKLEYFASGKVQLPDGSPAKGTKIIVGGFHKSGSTFTIHATTDKNGAYQIPRFQHDATSLVIQAYTAKTLGKSQYGQDRETCEPLVSEIVARECAENEELTCDLTLFEGLPLSGIVRDSDGNPAADQHVMISPENMQPIITNETRFVFSRGAITDREGKFKVYLPAGKYVVETSKRREVKNVELSANGEDPNVELALRNIAFIRLLQPNGERLLKRIPQKPLNMTYFYTRENEAGISSSGITSPDGDLEVMASFERAVLFFMSRDFRWGFAGSIPNNLKNREIFEAKMLPTAKARLRLVDSRTKEPCANQSVFLFVKINDQLFAGGTGSLRVGDMLQSDEQGYITFSVPTLGELKASIQYELEFSDLPDGMKPLDFPKFTPVMPGETVDLGDVRIE